MPAHTHYVRASFAPGNSPTPDGHLLAAGVSPDTVYHSPDPGTLVGLRSITNVGGSQAHENMQPYVAVNFCIALQGLFPSRN